MPSVIQALQPVGRDSTLECDKNLTIAVIATNGWNRLNIAFRPEVGDYRPGMFDQMIHQEAAR
jgi:hypothetical protein